MSARIADLARRAAARLAQAPTTAALLPCACSAALALSAAAAVPATATAHRPLPGAGRAPIHPSRPAHEARASFLDAPSETRVPGAAAGSQDPSERIEDQGPEPLAESTVGMPARIEELVLPGSLLEAAPADLSSAVVLRVTSASPHGSAFRYDLEYWGQEPGVHDLARYLRRADGSSTDDLPPIPVRVDSVLPAGQVLPNAPEGDEVPSFGGYRLLLAAAGALWVAGLVALLLAGRRRRERERAGRAQPRTLAERLRPMVEAALEGRLSRTERARLELSLVALWRRRLGLEDEPPEEVLAILRRHEEAGPLLAGLEEWLHRPSPPREVDLAALLAPYRDLPPGELDSPSPAAATRAP